VRRTVLIVIFLLMFNYLVLPRVLVAREQADLLRRVNLPLLVLALGLEVAAFVAYSVLTRVTLPRQPRLPLPTVFRIQLATKAVTNLVPGGSAAGGTLGFRLLTDAGIPAPAAGFTLATVGLGSAVVLNLLLWVALLISIPVNGFNPLYGTAAIIGLLLMLLLAALVFLLMKGTSQAERLFQAIARRIPFLNEVTVSRALRQVADRLEDLLSQPRLVGRSLLWAAANWLLDAAALWVFLRALGASVAPVNLIVAFGLANVLAAIPITPGGLGVVEAVLTPTLVGFGLTKGTATIGVLAYRVAQFWLPIPLGGLAYVSLKVGARRRRRLDARQDRTGSVAIGAGEQLGPPPPRSDAAVAPLDRPDVGDQTPG